MDKTKEREYGVMRIELPANKRVFLSGFTWSEKPEKALRMTDRAYVVASMVKDGAVVCSFTDEGGDDAP